MRYIGTLQSVYDRFGVRPVYVVDYPIASQQEGWGSLRGFLEEGRASIGAHLHPWVTPPYEEELSRRNSYHGNLPRHLEQAKLVNLTEQIRRSFGLQPAVFKAGRYGVGPNTFALLANLGYRVDLSLMPPMDFSDEDGPDYSRMSCRPFQDEKTGLLVLPGTGSFCGWWPGNLRSTYRWATTSWRAKLHAMAFFSRSWALLRIPLTPEGIDLREMILVTKDLLERGHRLFVLSLHSPSVMPGCTPYVRTEQDLQNLLAKLNGYFEYFFRQLQGQPWTPDDAVECWAAQPPESPRQAKAL